MKKKYIIQSLVNFHYYTETTKYPTDQPWTMSIEKAKPYSTLEEVEAAVGKLVKGFYLVLTVYRVV